MHQSAAAPGPASHTKNGRRLREVEAFRDWRTNDRRRWATVVHATFTEFESRTRPAIVDTKIDSSVQACSVTPAGTGTRYRIATPIAIDAISGTGFAPCSQADGVGMLGPHRPP